MAGIFLKSVLRGLARDVEQLPLGALQMVAALLTAEPRLPASLCRWLQRRLAQRAVLDLRLPLAQAARRLYVLAQHLSARDALRKTHGAYVLIKALQAEQDLHLALAFMRRLVLRFEDAQWLAGAARSSPLGLGAALQPAAADPVAAVAADAGDAIVTRGLDGMVTGWNGAAQRLFGYSAQEMLGRPMLLLLPDDRLQEEAFVQERLQAGEPVGDFRTMRLHKAGHAIAVSVRMAPLRDASGAIVGACKVARAISPELSPD